MVSVLLSVFNASAYIERCLKSLENQTLKDFELIIVNDGSTDSTKEVISNYLTKSILKYEIIDLKENHGIAFGRKLALSKANGDYFYFIDGDDWLEINAIETMYNEALSNNYDIVACDFYLNDGNNEKYFPVTADSPEKIICNNIAGKWVTVWRHMIKTTFANNCNLINIENLKAGEDYLLINQLSLSTNSIGHIHIPLYHYCTCNSSSIMRGINIQALAGQFIVTQIIESLVKKRHQKIWTKP